MAQQHSSYGGNGVSHHHGLQFQQYQNQNQRNNYRQRSHHNLSACLQFSSKISSELIGRRNQLFKSTEILNNNGDGLRNNHQNPYHHHHLPFRDRRNGKLHRSNPHLHFGGGGGGGQVVGMSQFHQQHPLKSSNSSNPSKSSLFSETASKWKSEISNVFPRKWCDLVFWKNQDNKLYRSESFRFIQKTRTILHPQHQNDKNNGGGGTKDNKDVGANNCSRNVSSSGPDNNGNPIQRQLHQIPVSEDYIDPLDQVLNNGSDTKGCQSGSGSGSTSSTSGCGTSSSHSGEPFFLLPPNHRLYNAPYYYSDTLKEPTYCSPCPTLQQPQQPQSPEPQSQPKEEPEGGTEPGDFSSLRPRSIIFVVHQENNENQNPSSHQVPEVPQGSCDCQSQESYSTTEGIPSTSPSNSPLPVPPVKMARKRYETAFLPSSCHQHSSKSPDIDSLILAIESSCSVVGGGGGGGSNEEKKSEEGTSSDLINSTSTCQSQHPHSPEHHHHHHHKHVMMTMTTSSTGRESSTATSSPCRPPLQQQPPLPLSLPLSEPLPQKKYNNNNNSSSISSSSSCSSSTSTSLTSSSSSSCRPLDKRLVLTMMKDNSVSSLDSIDSTKSEGDLHLHPAPFSRSYHHHHHNHRLRNNNTNAKILSPISDKSPLEPDAVVNNNHHHQSGNNNHQGSSSASPNNYHHPAYPINTAELINVPWEMPKIRRRLALLADSGISLDSSSITTQCSSDISNSSGIGIGMGSCDDSNFRYTTTTNSTNLQSSSNKSSSSSHIRNNQSDEDHRSKFSQNNQPGHPPPPGGSSQSSNSSLRGKHNLYLNFGDMSGGQVDEYYEDPRLSNYEALNPHPPWLGVGVTSVQVHVPGGSSGTEDTPYSHHAPSHRNPPPPPNNTKPDRCRMRLDFTGSLGLGLGVNRGYEIDPTVELEAQEWFHGAITRSEAEGVLRSAKEGSFLVRNCESSSYNRYSLSLKSARGYMHIRIEPNSLGTFSLGEHEFPSVPHLVLHFMYHRLPIKGAEHVKLLYPVITQLL